MRFLDPDPGKAEEEYRHLREALVRFFEWRNCENAKELTDETFARCVEKLTADVQTSVPNIAAYLYGIAHNIVLEALRKQRREALVDRLDARPVEQAPPDARSTSGWRDMNPIEFRIFLKECLARLPADDGRTLLVYHAGDRAALAKKLGISLGALRGRIHRIKKELKRLAGLAEQGDEKNGRKGKTARK